MLFVALTGRAGNWLSRPTIREVLDRVTGVVFVALGIRLARTEVV